MLRVLDELLWVLRREGFAISTVQAIDAARVVALVGFEDRRALRDALAAVIVDRRALLDRFQEIFDGFFDPDAAHPGDLWGRLRARGFADAELDALRQLLSAAAERSGASGDALGFLAVMGSDSELDQLLLSAGVRRALAPMTSQLQVGYFAQKVLSEIGVVRAASALRRIRDALRESLDSARGEELARALSEELERAKRRTRLHVEATLERRLGEEAEGRDRSALERPFTALSPSEIEEVRRAVRGFASRLRGAVRVRQKRAQRGRFDLRRTLRQSLRTGGLPFRPARRRRRRDKPRLWVLCDVSDSVRAASLFMLEFVYAAQDLFAGTRSFVFVSELGETTRLFAEDAVGSALARIYSGAVVSLAHNSNYGRALRAFEASCGRDVDRRSTIVILGDGRTNYFADEAAVVRRLSERARALFWICPEAPGSWGSGDSAMPRYVEAGAEVLVARSARELEDAAREVVARRRFR